MAQVRRFYAMPQTCHELTMIDWMVSPFLWRTCFNSFCRSFVPAESATLGIVDKSDFQTLHSESYGWQTLTTVFTRVSSRESVSKVILYSPSYVFSADPWWTLLMLIHQVQSSLMIDLNQVSLALRNSTARSLILLDEFGKGTLSAGSCNFLSDIYLLISSPAIPEIAVLTTPALRLSFSFDVSRWCRPL